jgi:hypothetical protein
VLGLESEVGAGGGFVVGGLAVATLEDNTGGDCLTVATEDVTLGEGLGVVIPL